MLDQGGGQKASPKTGFRQFVADTLASQLKRKYGITTRMMMKFLTGPDTINVTVNTEPQKLKSL
jgi:hypothetical protein